MIVPVGDVRFFAGQRGQLALQEVAEALPRSIDIFAVAEDEIHRHVEHIVDITFIAEAVLEHEGQHAGARGVGVGPDMAAVRHEAVGLAFGEGRASEECRRERLQGQRHAEFLHHVGFG